MVLCSFQSARNAAARCHRSVRYRTGSGSDRIQALNPYYRSSASEIIDCRLNIGSGRYHHPSLAARLGTPVRSRFCNDSTSLRDHVNSMKLHRCLFNAHLDSLAAFS
jgi:hypothetical protein